MHSALSETQRTRRRLRARGFRSQAQRSSSGVQLAGLGKFANEPRSASKLPADVGFNRDSPGRFYVSAVAKMILGHIIKNYELKLADENQSPTFGWGMNLIPHPKLKILLRERR